MVVPILLDFQNSLLIVAAAMNAFLGILIYVKHRNRFENQIYTLNIIFIIWWIIAMIFYRSNGTDLYFWTVNLYVIPTFIASTFLYFSLFFPGSRVLHAGWKALLIALPNAAVVALIILPGFVISGVHSVAGSENIVLFGPFYTLYAFYISLYLSLGLLFLFLKRTQSSDMFARRQISYLLVGYLIASVLAMVTNLLLPWFGNFRFNWMGQFLTLFMVIPVTYAIFRHRLFEAKVIVTELLVLLLSIFFLIRALLPQSADERTINVVLFGAALGIGLLLVRSVRREVDTRERIEQLVDDLEKANRRLRELDKLKTEFVSIASHQLRSPLAAVKGYASMLLEGSFGKLSVGAQEAIGRIFTSSSFMAHSVDDFLNVSRIELGRMRYEKAKFDICKIIDLVIEEQMSFAKDKNLTLSLADKTKTGTCEIYADVGKIKQVLTNLVDNAIKYTTHGSVIVTFDRNTELGKIILTVEDTGMGMSKATIGRLFKKFSRADSANEVNVIGTGLGLYVAKSLIVAQGGKIWATSGGEGKGSVFHVELPYPGQSETLKKV